LEMRPMAARVPVGICADYRVSAVLVVTVAGMALEGQRGVVHAAQGQ